VVDPLFWLGLSILLVAVSLTAVLIALLPAVRELSRAARSAEKLFDTLSRELPPTLEAIRLTGLEISDLTEDVSESVQSAGRVVKQFDDSLRGVKKQAKKAQVTTRSVVIGVKAAWKAFRRSSAPRRGSDRLPSGDRPPLEFDENYLAQNSSFQASEDIYITRQSYEMQSDETEIDWDGDDEDDSALSQTHQPEGFIEPSSNRYRNSDD
jgi:uncharacterized protein YoxC